MRCVHEYFPFFFFFFNLWNINNKSLKLPTELHGFKIIIRKFSRKNNNNKLTMLAFKLYCFSQKFKRRASASPGPRLQRRQVFGVGKINSEDIWVPVLFKFFSDSLFPQSQCRTVMLTESAAHLLCLPQTVQSDQVGVSLLLPPPRGFHFNIKLRQSLQPQRVRVHRSSDGDWFCCLKWVTKENWVFETFDPLNQSLRLCGNPYVHTCSTHCLLTRNGIIIRFWKNTKEPKISLALFCKYDCTNLSNLWSRATLCKRGSRSFSWTEIRNRSFYTSKEATWHVYPE